MTVPASPGDSYPNYCHMPPDIESVEDKLPVSEMPYDDDWWYPISEDVAEELNH